MYKTVLHCSLPVLLAGCVATSQPVVRQMTVPFDVEHARMLMRPGPGAIKGSAFLRQRGGGVVTCAGAVVTLVPQTAHARERVTAIYGSTLYTGIGYVSLAARRDHVVPSAAPPGYYEATRTTRCDAQGNFEFKSVADGDFYVQTVVQWAVGNLEQGVLLIAPVKAPGGQVDGVLTR